MRPQLRASLGVLMLAGLALLLLPAVHAAPADLDAELQQLMRLGYDKPEAALERLHLLQRQASSAEQRALLRMTEARLLAQSGEASTAQQIIDTLREQFGPQPTLQDRLELLRAEIADRQGQSEQAFSAAQRALDGLGGACDAIESIEQLPRGCDFRSAWAALRIIERTHLARGAYALAEVAAKQALELAQAGHDVYASAMSMGALALIQEQREQPELARRWLTQALQTAQGDALILSRIKTYQATVEGRRGNAVGQTDALLEALKLAREADAPHLLAQVQANLTDSYLKQNEAKRALQLAEQALPVLQRFKDVRSERVVRHNMALAHLKLQQFDQARAQLAEVERLRRGQLEPTTRIRELRELTEAWAAAGQPREAIRIFHEERALTEKVHARDREASLQQLKVKFDTERKQRDLKLLNGDKVLKEQQLANRNLAQQVGMAVAGLLGLSLILVVVMLRRVREANRRLKANQKLLREQSERDPLTDLANRRHFLAVMERHAKEVFNGALLMVDIDHFKHVNDEHGHAAGDAVICEVARRISLAVRSEDLVVRWGGEEFLVFVPGMAQAQLVALAERILFSVGATPVATENGPLRVTVSIGFAHFPLPPVRLDLHWERAVNWADMVLYTAKAQGRNRAVGITTVDAADADALLQIEADFDAACSSERVQLCTVVGPTA
ncbi:diguanylate cyclase [Paucibacter sp. APW11]|uniref:diguanylate cyclase n=1 Tax=Roseateles aquae TaxID=3077235 RepID=A0ABU3PEU2_9BURK|nr:diguanylate cyclase [Paucibacter sp. APW11]MDT9001105.1 diguanylate cyclase [Paucibacter sp. APW11]